MFSEFFGQQQFDNIYWFFFDLAIILLITKLLGLLMKKIGLPQVIGSLLGGLLVGPAVIGIVTPFEGGIVDNGLSAISQIGVIMIMFSAGIETDLKEIKKSGLMSFIIAALGIALPLGIGFLVAEAFGGGSANLYRNIFIGIILTATSVSITVETLKEMGKLKSKVGTTILSAAIIDDVLGIILLTIIISISGKSGESEGLMQWIFNGAGASVPGIVSVIINTVLFFAFAIFVGILVHKLFKWLAKKYPKNRRIPIFSLVFCLLLSFIAEEVFGVAEITGAYMAGIMLSQLKTSEYVERRIDISSYMIFTPVFFAFIGIKTTFAGLNGVMFGFAIAIIVVGILTKVIGCGVAARCCKFNNADSLRIGVGMVARGEVALIVAKKGIDSNIIDPKANPADAVVLPMTMLLVIITSFVTPICLKLAYKLRSSSDVNDFDEPLEGENIQQPLESFVAENPMLIKDEKDIELQFDSEKNIELQFKDE